MVEDAAAAVTGGRRDLNDGLPGAEDFLTDRTQGRDRIAVGQILRRAEHEIDCMPATAGNLHHREFRNGDKARTCGR